MENMVAVILGGGRGSRLFPLTKERSKPAVSIAGKYRLIDIPISNCINSGVTQMYVLTMYQSASLNAHISNAYRFDQFSRGFVQVLAAEQTAESNEWFQGTADAVRKTLPHLGYKRNAASLVLILSGDHLYRMNYRLFRDTHIRSGADLSIAVIPVTPQEAPELGVLKVDETGRITKFVEKPKTEEALEEMRTDTAIFGLSPEEAVRRPFLASMGIYIFDPETLRNMLVGNKEQTDFGKEIIPGAIATHKVQAYCFDGYWADIGTIRAFFDANLDLVAPIPKFNLFDPTHPIYSNARFLPGAKLNRASVEAAVLCDGTIVEGATVRDSILGSRARVKHGAVIEESLIMGADYYQRGDDHGPRMGINEGAYLKRCIIDKNASVGRYAQLVNRDNLQEYDDPDGRFHVRDGIIIVVKEAAIPDGFVF
ncbi:MAG: glucose-1-phosphate adenylyltransferase [Planctomycetota bacterium]|jgi:glucose-1-phosphate adenylyltransferase|nr:glucose-1-phosphate adenylyltransferase [Planctomycetota bacterium]